MITAGITYLILKNRTMKKIFNFILTIPLIGLLSIYLYVLMTIISINSTAFYNFDPKNTPVSFLFVPIKIISVVGVFIFIPLGFLILLIDYIKYKAQLTTIFFKWIYFIGFILTIFLHYVDLGYCQIWFAD
jgi:hypothetical protein